MPCNTTLNLNGWVPLSACVTRAPNMSTTRISLLWFKYVSSNAENEPVTSEWARTSKLPWSRPNFQFNLNPLPRRVIKLFIAIINFVQLLINNIIILCFRTIKQPTEINMYVLMFNDYIPRAWVCIIICYLYHKNKCFPRPHRHWNRETTTSTRKSHKEETYTLPKLHSEVLCLCPVRLQLKWLQVARESSSVCSHEMWRSVWTEILLHSSKEQNKSHLQPQVLQLVISPSVAEEGVNDIEWGVDRGPRWVWFLGDSD